MLYLDHIHVIRVDQCPWNGGSELKVLLVIYESHVKQVLELLCCQCS